MLKKPFRIGSCYRTLASVLKYDNQLGNSTLQSSKLQKGYYATEAKLVRAMKENVVGPGAEQRFKTIECSIMDLADDIAYSTYDLEDAFKGGFLRPLSMLAARDQMLIYVSEQVQNATNQPCAEEDVREVISGVFGEMFEGYGECDDPGKLEHIVVQIFRTSEGVAQNGYWRTEFTSDLIANLLDGIEVEFNQEHPCLSTVDLTGELRVMVEVLKHFVYKSIVASPHLNIAAERARMILQQLFKDLTGEAEFAGTEPCAFLPADYKDIYDALDDPAEKKRVAADFIAGMTDRYAVEFYGRLHSEDPQTIFKPL